MPIVYQKEVNADVKLAIWKIDESPNQLLHALHPADRKDIKEEMIEKKKLEVMATRLLVKSLVEQPGVPYDGLWKDDHGKPHLRQNESHMSISHAYPYAAAIIDHCGSTGIDIEAPRDQIKRISHKFMSDTELNLNQSIDRMTIIWAAKECLYKIYGRRQLIFRKDLSIRFEKDELLIGQIMTENHTAIYRLKVENRKGHWLVYKDAQLDS